MTSEYFKASRQSLGLSVRDLGHVTNVSEKTIRIWERGDRPPHPCAVRVMEWMVEDGFRPPEMEGLGND